MIKASLDPHFDSLEKDTTDLQMPLSTRLSSTSKNETSPYEIDAKLLHELTGSVAESIEQLMSPRLIDLDDLVWLQSRTQSRLSGDESSNAENKVTTRSPRKSRVTIEDDVKTSPSPSGPLTLPLHMVPAKSKSGLGMTQRHADLTRNRQPQRAFVVNFQRLIAVQKVLSLIHLMIKSTAIATFTLVDSADMVFSIVFLTCALAIYAIHEIRYDGIDIEDYKAVCGLLGDDDAFYTGDDGELILVANPNRLLKGVTLSKNHVRRRRSLLTMFAVSGVLITIWISVFWSWTAPAPDIGVWHALYHNRDVQVMAEQMLIGTVMLMFHCTFEWLYWRETQCVMPWDDDLNMPWDPRPRKRHGGKGVPPMYSWFGLPSMWFTSRETYDDVRLWITLATSKNPNTHLRTKIFPEELALFAINPDNACDLRKTLKEAKLFSLADLEFRTRSKEDSSAASLDNGTSTPLHRALQPGEEPEELQVDLVLYDIKNAQFLEPHEHQEYRSGVMNRLSRSSAVTTPSRMRRSRSRLTNDPWSNSSTPRSPARSPDTIVSIPVEL
jgi:hypothetical protein